MTRRCPVSPCKIHRRNRSARSRRQGSWAGLRRTLPMMRPHFIIVLSRFIMNSAMHHIYIYFKKITESALKGFWYRTCSNIWVFRNRCEVYQKRLWSAKSWTWHSTGQNGILFGSSGSIWAPNAGASISTNNIHRIMRCDPDMICAGYGSFFRDPWARNRSKLILQGTSYWYGTRRTRLWGFMVLMFTSWIIGCEGTLPIDRVNMLSL